MKYKKLAQRFRVPLGFAFALVFLIFARPEPVTLIVGGVVAVVGLLIRAWAAGHIRKNKKLAISGPYAYTRNPLYFGSFVMGLGFTVAAGVWWLALLFAVLFVGIYLPVMRAEAEELKDIFGEDYRKYQDRVSLFVPWFSGFGGADYSLDKFDFKLYLKYREYRAALGVVSALIVLTLKFFWIHRF